MEIISDGGGFALVFKDEADLNTIINELVDLRAERRATPTKSWPAFLDISARGATDRRARVRYLRYKLGEAFSD